MGNIICPEHGRQPLVALCEHLKLEQATEENRVVFELLDEPLILFTAYYCPDCREEIRVIPNQVQTVELFEKEPKFKETYVCPECVKSATA